MSRKMKDSNNIWIGCIPVEWDIFKIKRYCKEIFPGATPQSTNPDFWDGDINWIPSGSCHDSEIRTAPKTITQEGYNNSSTRLVPKNTALVAMTGATCGNTGFLLIDSCTNQSVTAYIEDKNICNSRYLWYVLQCSKEYLLSYKTGGAQSGINVENCKNIYVPLVPISEQIKISGYLDDKLQEINNIISKTQASIEEYKKLKQSIITQVVTQGVRGDREMKESGVEWIGQIPKNWDVTRISRIGITYSGATPLRSKESDYFEDATIRWVRTLDLNDWLVNDSSEKITDKALDNSSCTVMPVNTVCVAMYGGAGTIGKSGLLTKECATNQAICSIICDSTRIIPMYLLFYMITIRKYWMIYAVGTRKDPNISQDIVNKMNVIVPPIKEQERIVVYLQSKCQIFDDIIQKKNKFVEEMEKYKQSVIYEYVTGKKEVS